MDVVYDHFLAIDAAEFTDASLLDFSRSTYKLLDINKAYFPDNFSMMYPYMKDHNWLYNYKYPAGIQRSFEGICSRAVYMSESNTAFSLFNENYEDLQNYYSVFFPSLKNFSLNAIQSI